MRGSVLIFGGGPLQLSLIINVKKMGYHAIVIDPDFNAVGSKVADLFIKVEGDDFDKTLNIAIENKIKGIVTTATDKPILMMCRIAKILNLPFPSYESCEILLNKTRFKQFLENNNMPFAKGYEFRSPKKTIPSNLAFPVMIKPVMNSGSRGVIKCDGILEFQNKIEETIKHCENKGYLIEEYIQGDEISVETLVQGNKIHIIQITDKIVSAPPYNVELGHIQPSRYEYLRPAIEKLLQDIVDKLNLNNCALHPEMKVYNNRLTLIEIGPRLGGDFITSHLVPLSTGINIEKQLINITLGKMIRISPNKAASMVFFLNLPINSIISKTISKSEIIEKFPAVKEFKLDLMPGDQVKPITNSLNRYGHVILAGKDVQTLLSYKEIIEGFLINHLINDKLRK